MQTELKDWKCTDLDILQYGRKLQDKVYQYRELNMSIVQQEDKFSFQVLQDTERLTTESFAHKYWNNTEIWIEDTISVDMFTVESLKNIVSNFDMDYDGEYLTEENGEYYQDDAKLAKMIFEFKTRN